MQKPEYWTRKAGKENFAMFVAPLTVSSDDVDDGFETNLASLFISLNKLKITHGLNQIKNN